MSDDRDRELMARALVLAERGRGRTTPNPIVGAVVVDPQGVVIGQGAHLEAGAPHAEVIALEAAGPSAHGATLYCTLEPCAHTGRTGPCVERIAAAGVRRVVVAVRDPNPRVAGAGVAFLRARGVEVVEGVREAEATRANAAFFSWIARRRPHVTLKAAFSRDGFMGRPGERVRLTGAAADRFFHRQRAEVDAIAVGAGTVLEDDPQLTARGAYRHRPLVRVVYDWRGRVPSTARLFSTLDAGPVIMMTTRRAADQTEGLAQLEDRGVVVERFDAPALGPSLERLASREVLSLLVEGGPTLHAAFAAAALVDRVQWVMTCRVLGSGVALVPGTTRDLRWADRPRVTRLGHDILIEFDVHRADRDDRTD